MSVIFKTLEKARSPSPGEEEGARGLKRSRNVYSLPKMLISPIGVLALALLLILSALFSTYGGKLLGRFFSDNHKRPMLSETGPTLYAAVDGRPKDQAGEESTSSEAPVDARASSPVQEVPQPPADVPVEEAKPGRLYLPSSNLKKTPSPLASKLQYLPPQSQIGLEEPPGDIERAPGRSPLPGARDMTGHDTGEEVLGVSEEKSPQAGSGLLTEDGLVRDAPRADNIDVSYAPASGEEPAKTDGSAGGVEQRTITFQPGEGPPLAPGVARGGETTPSASPQGEKEPVLSACLHRDRPAVAGLIPVAPLTAKEKKVQQAERIYRVNLEKATRVGRVVSKIEKSMVDGNMARSKALIDQLAELKGEQNAYLLKLRAVWQMRQGDYESAARLLTKVLEKDKEDLEAGINMAIIEIRTHRLPEARKRLAMLREIYQSNTLIPKLIRETGG
jgi:hypothetical protein